MRRLLLLVGLLGGCGGARPEPSSAAAAKRATYACNGLKISAPAGGIMSQDEEGNIIVRWADQEAALRISREKPPAPPPIAFDAGSVQPSFDAKKWQRTYAANLFAEGLRGRGCEPTRDERATATWLNCTMVPREGEHAHLILGVGDDDARCLVACMSADGDPTAAATCDSVAPAS